MMTKGIRYLEQAKKHAGTLGMFVTKLWESGHDFVFPCLHPHPESKLWIRVMLKCRSLTTCSLEGVSKWKFKQMCRSTKVLFFCFLFSYGHLQAVNRTHLHWQWENTHHNNGSVFQDHLWIVQENHGMRDEPSQVSREDANNQTKDKGIDIHYWKPVWK